MPSVSPEAFSSSLHLLGISKAKLSSSTDFKKLEKQARKQWHPDRAMSLQLGKKKEDEFTEKSKLIDPAIETLKLYLKYGLEEEGKPHFTPPKKEAPPEPKPPPPKRTEEAEKEEVYEKSQEEERAQEYASMHEKLKEMWERIKKEEYLKETETKQYQEGYTVTDQVREEHENGVYRTAFFSYVGWAIVILPLILAVGIMANVSEVGALLGVVVVIGLNGVSLMCLLSVIPLSRIWLPSFVSDIMILVVEGGMLISQNLDTWILRKASFLGIMLNWILRITIFLGAWIYGQIAIQISSFFSPKSKREVREEVFYGGVPEIYIDYLLTLPVSAIKGGDLEALIYLYGKMEGAWERKR